jgi:hypothetical protein
MCHTSPTWKGGVRMRHTVAQACMGLGMLGVLISGVGLQAAVAGGKMY